VSERVLVVSLPGRRVGELVHDHEGRVRWRPDAAWEADGQHPRLGASFLLRPGPRPRVPGLPNWFENLLPERGSELRRRLTAAHGLRDGQSFALLAALGHDLLGSTDVRPAEDTGEASGPKGGDQMDEQPPTSTRLLSALTGNQLKFSMSMVDDRLAVPAKNQSGAWIVKLPGKSWDELAEVEDATMTWAHRAGFDVPDHFALPVTRLDGIPADWLGSARLAYAIRRFDRRDDGTRIHQEDLCQALDLPPGNKYGDEPRMTHDATLRFVTDFAGEEAGREMARRIGFMLASGNGDAHLKNWSLLWGDAVRPSLTPCYDLVCTIAWPELGYEHADGPRLALRLGGELLFRRIDAMALDVFSKRSQQGWAQDEVIEGIRRAKEAWGDAAGNAPERMRRALEVHWKNVPILSAVGL
jgi:serine/threonine-protein kinase HipA